MLLLSLVPTHRSFAKPLTKSDLQRLHPRKHVQRILFESYLQTDQGIANVFGYHFDSYIQENVAFILAIYGAVGGNRGGYGIAAFGLGYTQPLTQSLLWDTRVLLGSGGGGGLAAGGGIMWAIHTGLSYAISPTMHLTANYGYLKFPSGTFETPIFNIGVTLTHNSLVLPYP